MAKKSIRICTILLILLISTFIFAPAQAQEDDEQPVVRAVLFYSSACPHCETVIQQNLPPLIKQYGDQLKIVAINTALPQGQALYQAAIDHFQIGNERRGVPTLVVADIVMVGAGEIPAQFPGIIAEGLSSGGIDWPDVPGLVEVVAGVEPRSRDAQTGETAAPVIEGDTPPMAAKFLLDPLGNSISVIVLIGMLASIVWVVISFTRPLPEQDFWPKWVILVISVFGVGVAFYLTYVETSGVEAVCGPVGDCNTVQNSPYATLFGFLPVGLLGLIGYALILAGWAMYQFGPKNLHWASAISVWGMAFFGVLFSIYLTFLEPFVIGATCMWCISSAIFQAVIFIAATGPAKSAWQEDDFDDEDDFEDEDEEALNGEPENAHPVEIEEGVSEQ